ncbi:hypothetical protein F132_43 [Flavobacterium sp. phage 1/32]|nr:hypothetical protein F132_43 [Flavobacterium sp. phage 1/32]
MADNLKQLKANVDTVIPLNGGVASVKVANHNPHVKEIIEKAGRLTGFPFVAGRTPTNNAVPSGTMFWNGNAMNKTTPFDITLSVNTMDGNLIERILNLTTKGTIIHFKDFVGRSVTLELQSYVKIENFVILTVIGFSENTNYAYQVGEEELCMLEFVGVSGTNEGATNPFKDVEINLFWGEDGFSGQQQESKKNTKLEYILDANPSNPLSKTIPTDVRYLGIDIKNFEAIKNYNPKVIIERYKRRTKGSKTLNGVKTNFNSPAKYRSQDESNNTGIMYHDIISQQLEFAERPRQVELSEQKAYYDIFAENYYDKYKTPKPRTNKNFKTKNTPRQILQPIPIKDDTNVVSGEFNFLTKKGFVHLRLRLQIEYNNEILISEPLVYFQIVNKVYFENRYLDFPDNQNGVFSGLISYQYE